jgi:hypothetical protein
MPLLVENELTTAGDISQSKKDIGHQKNSPPSMIFRATAKDAVENNSRISRLL